MRPDTWKGRAGKPFSARLAAQRVKEHPLVEELFQKNACKAWSLPFCASKGWWLWPGDNRWLWGHLMMTISWHWLRVTWQIHIPKDGTATEEEFLGKGHPCSSVDLHFLLIHSQGSTEHVLPQGHSWEQRAATYQRITGSKAQREKYKRKIGDSDNPQAMHTLQLLWNCTISKGNSGQPVVSSKE